MTSMQRRRLAAPGLCALSLVIAPIPASAEYLSGCPVPPDEFWPELRLLPQDVVELEADSVSSLQRQTLQARGDVELFATGRRLESDWIDFHTETRRVETRGRSRLYDGDLLVEAGDSWYEVDSSVGEFSEVEYWMRSRRARGGADMAAQDGPGKMHLTEGSYTTCPEGSDNWWLTGSDFRLDQETGRGDARNVVLRFKNVPIFYTPYIQFPIDDRRMTGVLMPSGGYRKRSGVELAVPWYWNIAPHYDATLTPRILSDRGLMLETEWRYLRPHFGGLVDLRYLPDDQVFGEDRHLFRWQQTARPMRNLRFDVDVNDVSDTEYFRDFSTNLFGAGTAFVPRRGTAQYDWDNWRLRGRVENFQTLDPDLPAASRPYERMPQLVLTGSRALYPGLDLDLYSEAVRFDRNESVTANRLDVYPQAGFRWEKEGYFIEPKAGLRFTAYSLDNTEPGAETSITRTVPDISVDSGLFFERWLERGMIQTLEPRLFYGYVPFRDQDAIPVFDTRERVFRRDSLFSLQRFIGPDRIGDTHQITAAVTTRLIDPFTGTERLTLTGGQIHYFDERKVRQNPEEAPLPSGQSELVVGASAEFGRGWRADSSLQFDTDSNDVTRASAALGYQPTERALLNLGYGYQQGRFEQTDISAIWPLNDRLSAIGRWNFSLFDDQDLELLAGLEYRSCCYGMRVALRRHLVNSRGDYDNAIYFQITFNGLSQLDTGLDELLRQGIAGYGTFDNDR